MCAILDFMKRAAVYVRTSTVDQNLQTQVLDLEQMASQRGLEIVLRYSDQVSGTRVRRPGLDQMMADARRGRFDVLMVWASDRVARSVRHFLELLDELRRLNIEFISFREQIDTGGPLGRAVTVIIGAVAELERGLIVERVRAGMRRASSRAALSAAPHSCSTAMRSSEIGSAVRAWANSQRRTASREPLSAASSARKSRSQALCQKASRNQPPKPHKINSRNLSMGLCRNLYLLLRANHAKGPRAAGKITRSCGVFGY